MVIDNRQRCLEKIAYRNWLKNKDRSSEENWNRAIKIMNYIDKRRKLMRIIL